jgi:tetratricopeptide (TPR) repeat protein
MVNVSQRAFEANGKGERLFAEGKLDEALAAFNEAVLASPGYVAGWLNRAHVLERLGRVSEAEADREAARSLTAALQSQLYSVPAAQAEPAREWITATPPQTRHEPDSADVCGPGRYILNFFLAGLVGLVLTLVLRNHGWLATWISLALFGAGVVMLVVAGPEALGLDFESSTR